jgi:hypothetical protein
MAVAKCELHPGRASAEKVFGVAYCQQCLDGIKAPREKVDKHVEPRDCFIVYVGKDTGQPIDGTGCAHWMSRQESLTGTPGRACCLAGFMYRVGPVIHKFHEIASVKDGKVVFGDIAKVKSGNFYAELDESHCGIVIKVTPPKKGDAGALSTITIRNDSSAQGGVKDNDFADYFKSTGKFLA